VEDSRESNETFGELEVLGGVRPRVTAPFDDSCESGVGCPRMDLVSEEDRSCGAGLWENSRRIDAPIDEARLLLRVSSFFKSIKLDLGFGSRTIPRDGTADNLSMSGGNLFDACAGRVPVWGPVKPLVTSGVLNEGRTMLLVILTLIARSVRLGYRGCPSTRALSLKFPL